MKTRILDFLCGNRNAFGAAGGGAHTGSHRFAARRKPRATTTITNTFEFGYRWSLVGGDDGQYRSTVNYRNGPRLLGSSLSIDSKDGHGHYFDQILLNTMGLGNDPYEFVSLRVQKNQLVPLRHDVAAARLLQSRPDGRRRTALHGHGAPHTGSRSHVVSASPSTVCVRDTAATCRTARC